MSIFGSLSSAISPDYFGDEFGLPLPKMVRNKEETTKSKPTELGNPGKAVVLKEAENGFRNCMRMAIAPGLDGLFCFETFVFSNLKQ